MVTEVETKEEVAEENTDVDGSDSDSNSSGLPSDLLDEIDAGVDAVTKELNKKDSGVSTEENIPSDKTQSDDDLEDDSENGEGSELEDSITDGDGQKTDDNVIPDALLERAVQCGIPLAQARKYPEPEMLEGVCEQFETLSGKNDESGGSEDGETGEVDLFANLPELDPEEVDEGIVNGFNSLKDIVKQQHETIKNLMVAKSGDAEALFDSKVRSLGEGYEKALKADPAKRALLKTQVDILKAGYEKNGVEVDIDSVFEQAVKLSLDDVTKDIARREKQKKVRRRSSSQISRPGGTNSKITKTPEDEAAEAVDRKFFS